MQPGFKWSMIGETRATRAARQAMTTTRSNSEEGQARRATMLPALAGFGLVLAAALLLWLRFGTAIFIDGLTAEWSCF